MREVDCMHELDEDYISLKEKFMLLTDWVFWTWWECYWL